MPDKPKAPPVEVPRPEVRTQVKDLLTSSAAFRPMETPKAKPRPRPTTRGPR